jgi:hypothetical protein
VIFDNDLPFSSLWDTTGQFTPGNPLCYSYATPRGLPTGGGGTSGTGTPGNTGNGTVPTGSGGTSGTGTPGNTGNGTGSSSSNSENPLESSSDMICFSKAKKWSSQMKKMDNSDSKAFNNLACQFATYVSNVSPSNTDQMSDFEIKAILPQFYMQALSGKLLGNNSIYIIDQSADEIQRQLGLTADGINDNNMESLLESGSSESRLITAGIIIGLALVIMW